MELSPLWKAAIGLAFLFAGAGVAVAGNNKSAPAPKAAAPRAVAPRPPAPNAAGVRGMPSNGFGGPARGPVAGARPLTGPASAVPRPGAAPRPLPRAAPPAVNRAPPPRIAGPAPGSAPHAPAPSAAHAPVPSAAHAPVPAAPHGPVPGGPSGDRFAGPVSHPPTPLHAPETRGGPGRGPAVSPAVHVAGPAAAHLPAARDLAVHRAEFARNFGPGHDVARDREFVHAHEHDFHTRNVRDFDAAEMDRWHSGVWHQDWHYGRWGWWYDTGDVWYPYDAPIYPYPLVVSEIVVPDAVVVDVPAGVTPLVVGPAAVPVAAPVTVSITSPEGAEMVIRPLPAAPVVNYQCSDPLVATYPVIRLCPITWVPVAR
jgi:hypothetical protein